MSSSYSTHPARMFLCPQSKKMKFSDFGRFLTQGSGIVQLMEDFGDAHHSEQEVSMLGGGNPGAIPEVQSYYRSAMATLLKDENRFDSMIGSYDSPEGEPGFRAALACLLRETYGWDLSAANIAVTNGSQSTFFVLFNLFSGRFENQLEKKILLPLTPEYIGYEDAGLGKPIFTSNKPSIESLDQGMFKYHVDLDRLHVDESIGAMCVSRPTNPTGNVLTDQEVDLLRARCRKHDIPLIIDCAYGTPFPNIIFNDATPVWDENIILCMSLSKLGLPGVRTGIVIASEQVISAISASNAILSLAPGSVGPVLISDALQNGEILNLSNQFVKPFYQHKAQQAVDLFHSKLGSSVPYRIHQPEGAIFLWLWFEGLPITSKQLYRRLKRRGVYVIAGEHFFPGLEDHEWRHRYECIRVSYAQEDRTVERGINIIADEIRKVYAKAA